jgi:uncharacterized protein YjdB
MKMKKCFTKIMLCLAVIFMLVCFPQSASAAYKPKLEKKTVSLEPGDTYKIKLKKVPKNTKIKMSYSADNNYVSVSKKGKIKAKDYPGKKTKISVKVIVKKRGKKSKTYKLTQTVKIVDENDDSESGSKSNNSTVSLNKTYCEIRKGEYVSLDATVKPSYENVTWTSSNPNVATVGEFGWVDGINIGTATITASLENGSKAQCVVVVKAPKTTDVSINMPQSTISVGESITVSAVRTPADSNDSITWEATNDCISIVGQGDTAVITGKKAGTGRFKANYNGRSESSSISVQPENKTYGLNETWEVQGQWRFKITGVEIHKKCNSYSSKTGEEVVLVSYSYENIGYNKNGGLFMSLGIEQCYDSQGNIASSYPCTHETKSKRIVQGGKCVAKEAFILPKKGEKLRFYIDEYTSNSERVCATFEIPYNKKPNQTIRFDYPLVDMYMDETSQFNLITSSSETVNWASKDTSVVMVDTSTGKLTPIAPGMTTVYALQGDNYAEGTVNVNALKMKFLDHGNNLTSLRVQIENTTNVEIKDIKAFYISQKGKSGHDTLFVDGNMVGYNTIPAKQTVTFTVKLPDLTLSGTDTPFDFNNNSKFQIQFEYKGRYYAQQTDSTGKINVSSRTN